MSLKRSSPLICRFAGIQRHTSIPIRSFFNQPSSSSSSVVASSSTFCVPPQSAGIGAGDNNNNSNENKSSGSVLGLFLKSVSGISLASGLGFWFWSTDATPPPSSSDLEDPKPHSTFVDTSNKKKPKFLFGDSFRRKVFFNYEKRIRMRSPPEKVFEYFASIITPEGEVLMTPADLMRAVIPVFPPSESERVREGYLRGERAPGQLKCATSTFFMLFDTNNDGLISFAEYIFFVTLLSIPESSFSIAFKMFDLDNNGEIDREEFKKVMTLMRSQHRQGAHHRDGRRVGLKIGESVENGGLLEFFFGKEGNLGLEHEKFVDFLRGLHNEVLRLEFAHYDYKGQGTISAKDFALSMVASADMSLINKFLDRVDKLDKKPDLIDIRFTWEEFMAFAELRKRLEPLSLAIFTYGKLNGLLTKKDFKRAASNVCGITLSDNVVDIIFHVFDTNRDGILSVNEFVKVLHRRERAIGQPSTDAGLMGSVSGLMNCAKSSSFNQVFL